MNRSSQFHENVCGTARVHGPGVRVPRKDEIEEFWPGCTARAPGCELCTPVHGPYTRLARTELKEMFLGFV
jgi:hypothetical protein